MTDPDVPLLAELDAGLLDPGRAREVERAARADPRSAAVLDALAATRAELAAVPAPAAPPELVAGWLAALDAAGPGTPRADPDDRPAPDTRTPRGGVVDPPRALGDDRPAPRDPGAGDPPPSDTPPSDTPPSDTPPSDTPPSDTPPSGTTPAGTAPGGTAPGPQTGPVLRAQPAGADPGRRRPRSERPGPGRSGPRRGGWVLAAAAAALVVAALVLRPTGPPALARVELAAVARSTVGTTDLGELADPARRDGCLTAAGYRGARVLGGRQVRWEGRPGVLLVLSTGELGVFRALVLAPGCAVLADEVVGR
jgi:hypothetical protein